MRICDRSSDLFSSDLAEGDMVSAEVDFLVDGDEDDKTEKLVNFKRGITSYPIPGNRVFPVAGDDLKQMFSADERPHIEIGTVYPTRDVRRALYIEALPGKHFALLGSTEPGKQQCMERGGQHVWNSRVD